MTRMGTLALAAALMAVPALAQQPQPQERPVDVRIAGPMIRAQAAEIALRDAAMKAMGDDAAKREADLAAWFKAWFGAEEK